MTSLFSLTLNVVGNRRNDVNSSFNSRNSVLKIVELEHDTYVCCFYSTKFLGVMRLKKIKIQF